MPWPYPVKKTFNVGTLEEPIYEELAVHHWIPGNKGPYQICAECRRAKEKRDAAFREKNPEVYIPMLRPGWPFRMVDPTLTPKLPPFKLQYALPASSRCLTHTLRFHKANGTLTPAKEAEFRMREEIHEMQRQGQFYKPKD